MQLNKIAVAGTLVAGLLCGAPPGRTQDLSALYGAVSPAIVVIKGDDSLGSGFIVSEDGKIATNAHVIMNMSAGSVKLQNGEEHGPFKVLGIDLKHDLAVIEIRASGLPTLPLRDSDTVRIGDKVVILGAPVGLDGTLTSGAVSAVRPLMGTTLIQFDATVNPGSSGGPMLDADGKVAAVVSSGIPGAARNIGFAIPANALHDLLGNLRDSWSLDEMRDLLKGGIEWVDIDPKLFSKYWRRQGKDLLLQLEVSESSIAASVMFPGEVAAAGLSARYVIEKRDIRWLGAVEERRPCLSATYPRVIEKVCSVTHEVQMTLLTPYRIEGRLNTPTSAFDCRRCAYQEGSTWQDFVWIPAGGLTLE